MQGKLTFHTIPEEMYGKRVYHDSKFGFVEVPNHMYKKESDLLKAVIKWIEPQRRNGIVALKIRDRYAIGYSDLFICAKGRFIVAELKDDIGKASPHQEDFIKMMKEAGAVGGICRSVEDVANLIKEALDGH